MYFLCLFFFFKQKTAYEMRISDWSSDVCSSDLGQQVRELACGVRADAGDDIGEVGLRVEAIEPGRLNQRVDGGGALSAGIGAGKEVVLASEGDAAQGPLSRVVVDRPAAVVEIAQQVLPPRQGVAHGRGQAGSPRQLGQAAPPPGHQES